MQTDRSTTQITVSQQRCRYLSQRIVSWIDRCVAQQLDAILHHPRFQELEASWRSIAALVTIANDPLQGIPNSGTIVIRLLNMSWQEASEDLARATDIEYSHLFRLVYSEALDTPGASPFSVLVGDYRVCTQGPTLHEVDTLLGLTQIASVAMCPFITSVHPQFLDLSASRDMASQIEQLENTFRSKPYRLWQDLRKRESSRFLGLTFPDVLLRNGHHRDRRRHQLNYRETLHNAKTDYLWGNSAYAYASTLMKTFAETGWFVNLQREYLQREPGQSATASDHDAAIDQRLQVFLPFAIDPDGWAPRPSTSIQLDDNTEKQLSNLGFLPLCSRHTLSESCFYNSPSFYQPPTYDRAEANLNAQYAAWLPYTLGAARIGHCIKVIVRDRIGHYTSAKELKALLMNYLRQYTSKDTGGLAETRAKKPLANYHVDMQMRPGEIGAYSAVVLLQPHGQCGQMISSIKLVTQLSLTAAQESRS